MKEGGRNEIRKAFRTLSRILGHSSRFEQHRGGLSWLSVQLHRSGQRSGDYLLSGRIWVCGLKTFIDYGLAYHLCKVRWMQRLQGFWHQRGKTSRKSDLCFSGGEHGGHPAETPEACRLEQGASPCTATSQERQSVLSDRVKGNGQTNHLPTIFLFMEQPKDIKREQIKALIEKMKQEGKPIDWATIVLCWTQLVLL